MLTLDFPQTIWSQRHADVLNAAASVAFLPLSFDAMPSNVAHAEPANPTATTSNSGTAANQWNAAIEAKIKPGVTRQQAAVLVAKERPDLQAAYVAEHREQVAARRS